MLVVVASTGLDGGCHDMFLAGKLANIPSDNSAAKCRAEYICLFQDRATGPEHMNDHKCFRIGPPHLNRFLADNRLRIFHRHWNK